MTFRKLFINACRLCCVVLLVFASRQVSADCRSDMANGWQMNSKCTTEFDAQGNYVQSYCGMDANTISSGPSRMTCTPGLDEGTCTGSTCEGELCTRTGACFTDADCCGENVCNETNFRCEEPRGGGGWAPFQ